MADDDYVTIGNTGGSQGGVTAGPKNKLPFFLQKLFGDLTNFGGSDSGPARAVFAGPIETGANGFQESAVG
jgi:hypothetical protein